MVGTRCLSDGSLNAAASRLYYAVFQAVLGFAKAKRGYVYSGSGAHAEMLRIVRNRDHGGKGTYFGEVYPDFPITVMESPDDRLVLCVRVFAVPEDKIREFKAAIRQIERDLISDGQYLLLPMVKNLEVTKQHVPCCCQHYGAGQSRLLRQRDRWRTMPR